MKSGSNSPQKTGRYQQDFPVLDAVLVLLLLGLMTALAWQGWKRDREHSNDKKHPVPAQNQAQ